MYWILAVLVTASQTLYYEAKNTTFGCTSMEEVSKLQGIRLDKETFETELHGQIFYGQCVEILKGTLVEGMAGSTDDSSVLLVDRQIMPPGYLAPSDDFERKTTDGGE